MSGNLHREKIALAFGAVFVIWGSTYLAIRYAIETIPPFMMAGTRNVMAGIPLLLWVILRERSWPSAAEWRRNAVIGGFLFVGGHGAVAWAEQHVPSGLAALIMTTIPLMMAGLDALRPGGARLTGRILMGLLTGFFGVALLIGPADFLGGEPVDAIGAVVLLGGALSWSFGSVYGRSVTGRSTPLQETMMRVFAGGCFLLLASLLAGETQRFEPAAVSLLSVLSLGYLVVFGSIVTFTAYTWLLAHTTPARVGTYAYINPVVALLLGWGIGDEPVSLRVLVAGLLVPTSVAIVLRSPRREPTGVASTEAAPSSAAARPSIAYKEDSP